MAWTAHEAYQIGQMQAAIEALADSNKSLVRQNEELHTALSMRDEKLYNAMRGFGERIANLERAMAFARGGYRGAAIVFGAIITISGALGWVISNLGWFIHKVSP